MRRSSNPSTVWPSFASGSGNASESGAQRRNMTSLLALKLLLLAFFILLTAFSSRESQKAQAVLDSVQDSFAGSVLLSDSADDQSSAAGAQSAEMRVQEALGQLFQNMLPLSGRRESRQGSEVFLELSAGTFFGPGRTAFQPGRRVLLERLAVALSQAAASGVDFELQLFHSAGQGAAAASLATERTAAMAAELARQGVAPARLTVGLLPPDGRAAAHVRIVLRVATAAAATGAPA